MTTGYQLDKTCSAQTRFQGRLVLCDREPNHEHDHSGFIGHSDIERFDWGNGAWRRILRALGSYGGGVYQSKSPALLWQRINHRLFGLRRGCSCTRCFHHPRRRVPAREIYDGRVQNAKRFERLEGRVKAIERGERV